MDWLIPLFRRFIIILSSISHPLQADNKLCDIGEDITEELKKFRFRKSTNSSALICKYHSPVTSWFGWLIDVGTNQSPLVKVDREKQRVVLDEYHEDISVDDLREELPGHQPRYIVYSYRMEHADKRVSYPICFFFYTPRDSQVGGAIYLWLVILCSHSPTLFFFQMDLQMLYAGTKTALVRAADLTRVYEIRELEDFTEEWLQEKLK